MKILILQKQSDDGCTWYRLTQFAKEANAQGLADVQFINLNSSEEVLFKIFKEADMFIGRLNPELGSVVDIIKTMSNKPLVIDIDDSIDDINPYSDHYAKLGTEEVPDLWKDGEGGFSITDNKKRIDAYRDLLRKADVVTATTLDLAEYVKQYNENVAIVPNYIDPDNFPVLTFAPTNQINILWSGGSSHFADLWEIKPVIESIMLEYPQVHFYILGVPFGAIVKGLPKDRVHAYGWVKPDGHGFRLACMQPHIGICPIIDSSFNRLKSSIKYYELSALGVATVAKNIPPYSNDMIDGQTGYLYNDNDQLRACLEQLILDPINRMVMSQNAYKDVLGRRNIKTGISDWISLMKGIKDAYSGIHSDNGGQGLTQV